MPSQISFRTSAVTLRTNQFLSQKHKWQEYYSNPKLCKHCNYIINWFIRTNKFCSHSCSASHNNSARPKRSIESRTKTSTSLKVSISKIRPAHTKIKFCICEICLSNFIRNSIHKGSFRFCSNSCRFQHNSVSMSAWLKVPENRKNYGRGKLSYLEKSFTDWLIQHNITFEYEKPLWNNIKQRNYFPDFFFPLHNLIIELDGTQHRNTVEQDKERDLYITKTFGYTVLRITHKEYQSKSKLQLLESILF